MERSCFSPTGRRGSSKEDVQHTECGAVAELCCLDTDVSGTKVKWVLSVLSVGRTDYSEVGTELCLKSSGMVWYIPWCLGNAFRSFVSTGDLSGITGACPTCSMQQVFKASSCMAEEAGKQWGL